MILTPGEIATYAPTVKLTGVELVSAIRQAQLLAEGVQGANRPLEIESCTEELFLVQDSFYLPRMPVVEIEKIEVKGMSYNNFDMTFVGGTWVELGASTYSLDPRLGEVVVRSLANYPLYQNVQFQKAPRVRSRPASKVPYPRLKVQYKSGYDFTQTTNYDVVRIKSALGQLLTIITSDQFQGVKTFELTDFYTIDYSQANPITSASASSILDEYLLIFKAYRPREFF